MSKGKQHEAEAGSPEGDRRGLSLVGAASARGGGPGRSGTTILAGISIFEAPPGGWVGSIEEPTATLTASDLTPFDGFGRDVAIDFDGNSIVVGSPSDATDGTPNDAAYRFVKPLGGWTGVLTETSRFPHFSSGTFLYGTSVATDGGISVVGDPLDAPGGGNPAVRGAAFAYLSDGDSDNVPDVTDNCPDTSNGNQSDVDGDGLGDVCDPDADGDGLFNAADNAPLNFNPDQSDIDGNGVGDVADPCPSDPTDSCDPSGSAANSIGTDGGVVATADGSVAITEAVNDIETPRAQ